MVLCLLCLVLPKYSGDKMVADKVMDYGKYVCVHF
jgi:hypothetical protein